MLQADFEFSDFKAGYNQPSSLLCVDSTTIGVPKRHLNSLTGWRFASPRGSAAISEVPPACSILFISVSKVC